LNSFASVSENRDKSLKTSLFFYSEVIFGLQLTDSSYLIAFILSNSSKLITEHDLIAKITQRRA